MFGCILPPAVMWEVPKSSQMNPYRDCGLRSNLEDELWQELDEALADALRDPGWAAMQASWVMMDATELELWELVSAAGALLRVLTT